jgi:hypothetical protein
MARVHWPTAECQPEAVVPAKTRTRKPIDCIRVDDANSQAPKRKTLRQKMYRDSTPGHVYCKCKLWHMRWTAGYNRRP